MKKSDIGDVQEIRYRWDSEDPKNLGWYAQFICFGQIIGDSEKIGSPVDFSDLRANQEDLLKKRLKDIFWDAEIINENNSVAC